MSLQFFYGPSGSGKSHTLYQKIIEESIEYPEKEFLVIVPEQFTMQTQKQLVRMHPLHGILNIDVLSFGRLAWRIFEETGEEHRLVLEDTGKNLLLRKVAAEHQDELQILGSHFRQPGYIAQVKSVISEFKQYDISLTALDTMIEEAEGKPELSAKLQDIRVLYEGFEQELAGHYITAEEVLEVLCNIAGKSDILKGCVLALDGFTGFTPIQNKLLEVLMPMADQVLVTAALDPWEDPLGYPLMHHISYLSKKMFRSLTKIAKRTGTEILEPVILGKQDVIRYEDSKPLAFLEKHLFRYHKDVYDKKQEAISLHVSKNPAEETIFAARTIWQLTHEEGLRYQDIAMICGDMGTYADYIRETFQTYDLPVFVDQTRKILLNPLIEFVRAALTIVQKGFRYENVFHYLRTGLTGMETGQIDLLETYVLAGGIRGRRKWEQPFTAKLRTLRPEQVELCEEARKQFLAQFLPFADGVKGAKGTVREKTESLYYLIEGLHLQEKMKAYETQFLEKGRLDAAKEYKQIYGILIELFDKLVELLGEERMSLEEYAQILDAGFAEAKVGMVPPTADCIMAGDLERTRLSEIKVLLFLGLNDGWVPKREERASILSEIDRETLEADGIELAPNVRESSYIQKFYLYLSLCKPSKRLYLSYSLTGMDGKSLRPSYVAAAICRLFPKMKLEEEDRKTLRDFQAVPPQSGLPYLIEGLRNLGRGQDDEDSVNLVHWYAASEEWQKKVQSLVSAAFLRGGKDSMSEQVAHALYGSVLENSVSRLEKFASCAYAHFLNYGLQLDERETDEFHPVDMGNIFHAVLEEFANKVVQGNYDWFNLPKEVEERLTEETVTEVTERLAGGVLHASARNEYAIARIKRIMKRTIWALLEQVRSGHFIPGNFEVAFSAAEDLNAVNLMLSEKEKMRLKGRIDRIDTCETGDKVYVKVIDYKSGNNKFDLVALYYGLQLQLVVYLNAALELEKKIHPGKKVVPAGILYYYIDDPVLNAEDGESEEAIQERLLKELRPGGLLNGENEVIDNLDKKGGTSSLVIPVSRKKDGSFTSYSQVAGEDQFQLMSEFVTEKMKKLGRQIIAGETSVAPYVREKQTACDYCPYSGVCGYDKKVPGTIKKVLKEYKEDIIWEKMREEEQDGSELDEGSEKSH